MLRRVIEKLGSMYPAQELAEDSIRNVEIIQRVQSRIDFVDDGYGGSPTPADMNFLALLVRWLAPKLVLEIGTWVGTSATVMAEAGAEMVYTCDRRDLYRGDHEAIHFFSATSTNFLKGIAGKLPVAGFAFIDANLQENDATNLLRFFRPGHEAIAVHDMHLHNGCNNMVRLTCRQLDAEVYFPSFDDPVNINGTLINEYCGLVLGRELVKGLGL